MPPPRPTSQKPGLGNNTPGPQSGTSTMKTYVSSFSLRQDVSQELHSLPQEMAITRGPPHPDIGPHGPAPLTLPPGATNPPFLNQPQLTPPQPVGHMQPPLVHSVPQQFQPGPCRGIIPVPPQINPQHASQMLHQGYIPAPWQKSTSVTKSQPPVPLQSQSQSIPTTVYWPTLGAHTQTQPGLPVQPGLLPVSLSPFPGEAKVQPFPPSLVNQFHPAQPTQNLPNMPQRIALPQVNLYFPGGTPHSQGQPFPPQNMCLHPTTQFSPMFQTGNPFQNQNIPPQNNLSSGPITVPVMDNPNPPALGGILAPSPAHPLPSLIPNLSGPLLKPSTTDNSSDGALNHDFFQDKMDKLSIASQEETSDYGEDKVK